MKLLTARLSPFAARCRMYAYARGLTLEHLEYPQDISTEDILAANPMGKIPVLIDGDLAIAESEAICLYLEDRFAEDSLLPHDIADKARCRVLCRTADLYVMEPLVPLFAHLSRKHRNQDIVDAGLAQIRRGLGALEVHISADGYAVSDGLSLADCTLVPILLFVNMYLPYFGVEQPLSDYPRLAAYWQSMEQNVHAQKVIDEIKQGIQEKSKG